MKIEGFRLKNFKIFCDLKLTNLPDMAVFLGANGSGKSTLFDAFGFLLSKVLRQQKYPRGGLGHYRL